MDNGLILGCTARELCCIDDGTAPDVEENIMTIYPSPVDPVSDAAFGRKKYTAMFEYSSIGCTALLCTDTVVVKNFPEISEDIILDQVSRSKMSDSTEYWYGEERDGFGYGNLMDTRGLITASVSAANHVFQFQTVDNILKVDVIPQENIPPDRK